MTSCTPLVVRLLAAGLMAGLPPRRPALPPDDAHDFDFEIGRWRTHLVRLRRPLSGDTTWIAYDGTSVVRPMWGGRANVVELDVDGPDGRRIRGLSLRLYDARARQWSLTYVNAASGTAAVPTVGAFADGRGEFFDWEAYDGRMILARNVFTDVTPTSYRFEQSYSVDGGKTWELNWVATDTRLPDAPNDPGLDASRDAAARAFDFEPGAWTVRNARLLQPMTDSARWIRFGGTSVARPMLGGRAVLLELGSDAPSGHADGLILRTFDPVAREWNVAFARAGSGTLGSPAIGGFRHGRGAFYAMERLDDGRTVLSRSVLSNITPTSYRLESAYSADGGAHWQVDWISAHTRVPSPAAPAARSHSSREAR